MKSIVISAIFVLSVYACFAQDAATGHKPHRKGSFYFYWGYSREWFTNSDIRFTGANYDFTLRDVVAKDRQTAFDASVYMNPCKVTIPQFNFRVGYFLRDNYNISFGIDHMKYVVQQNQVVKISGNIEDQEEKYNGNYSDDDIALATDFLMFEHTNGLNYLNIELRRLDEIAASSKLSLNIVEGLGAGMLLPRTDATLLNMERHDEFHVAGYGIGGVVGINFGFFKHFFLQTEYKWGYINMPDIRTTKYTSDKASQHFFFSQYNVVLGASINILHPEKKNDK